MTRIIEKFSNPIVKNIIAILYFIVMVIITILTCIVFIILFIPAIPYAIVRRVCNLKYYKDWFNLMNKTYSFRITLQDCTTEENETK